MYVLVCCGMWRLCTVSVSAVCVPPRDHENEASVNVYEVLPFEVDDVMGSMKINCRVRAAAVTLFGAPQGLHASLPRSKAVRWDAVGLAARVGGREEAQRGA
jgi:hypothetical protein